MSGEAITALMRLRNIGCGGNAYIKAVAGGSDLLNLPEIFCGDGKCPRIEEGLSSEESRVFSGCKRHGAIVIIIIHIIVIFSITLGFILSHNANNAVFVRWLDCI